MKVRAEAIVQVGGSDLPDCPACGARDLVRIRRRPIDRVLSMFVQLRRFRCPHFQCQWQGNLTSSGSPPLRAILKQAEISWQLPKAMYVPALVSAIAAIAFGAVVAMTDLPVFERMHSVVDGLDKVFKRAQSVGTPAAQIPVGPTGAREAGRLAKAPFTSTRN